MKKSSTINYYDQNTPLFIANTIALDLSDIYARFLKYLPASASICDVGCGAGRDMLAFAKKGHRVLGIEPSAKLAAFAKAHSGQQVCNCSLLEFMSPENFDAIWACASLLHFSRKELPEVFLKLKSMLKSDGVIYCSFKLGDFEGEKEDGRYFTSFSEADFGELAKKINATILDQWVSVDLRPKNTGQWLNIICGL